MKRLPTVSKLYQAKCLTIKTFGIAFFIALTEVYVP